MVLCLFSRDAGIGKNRHLWDLILAPPTQAVSPLSANVDSELWSGALLVLKTLW